MSDKTDFNDMQDRAKVQSAIDSATTPTETDAETFARLAKLSLAEYDRCRDREAERLKIRAITLDAEVRRLKPKPVEETTNGEAVIVADVKAWPDAVDGAALADGIKDTIRRYVIMPTENLIACVLFVLHTYAFNLGDISPILFITGPTKRCGKSRLLSVLARLVNKALAASSASPAGIYRTIEIFHPTLLIDEVDAFMRGNEELRGLVNSGHTRDAAFHLACRGDDHEPCRFSTWTPKILCGIGKLAGTIEDRAVIIQMERRRRQDVTERLRHGTRFEELRQQCARFIADNEAAIKAADPTTPATLNDRAADNWTPLLALADLIGGDWPKRAREAAIKLSTGEDVETTDQKEQLLSDIRTAFISSKSKRLSSAMLCERLAKMEGRPWGEYGERNQKPITMNQLAKLLAPFKVTPRNIRIDDEVLRGYDLADFAEVFDRYLPEQGHRTATPLQGPSNKGETAVSGVLQAEGCSTLKKGIPSNGTSTCSTVAPVTPFPGEPEFVDV